MNPGIQAVEGLVPAAASRAPNDASMRPNDASIAGPPVTQFGQWFSNELAAVNTQMLLAERSTQLLAAGGSANLHDTMLQLEQARMQFQLAIQVRSRVLEAYQDIMRMQV